MKQNSTYYITHPLSLEIARHQQSYILVPTWAVHEALILPKLERVLDRSMMALLLGLLRTDLLARDISAVTRVIDIL